MSYPNTVNSVFSHLDRWFDDLFGASSRLPPPATAYNSPAVNVWDDGTDFHLEAVVPGLDPDKLELEVTGEKLVLAGEYVAPSAEATLQRQERPSGTFRRELSFPVPLAADQVKARLKDGLLIVDLPRAEAAKPRQIKVKKG